MTLQSGWVPSTRMIGVAVYLFTVASCCVAWARGGGKPRRRRLAVWLAALEVGLLLDMASNGRWVLHDLLKNEAIAENLYSQRASPQKAALVLLCAAAVAGMGLALHLLRRRAGAALAVCGAILSLSFWCAEVISLHAYDAAFHSKAHGVMFVGLVWVAGALMTGLGMLLDLRVSHDASQPGVRCAGAPPSSLTDS
jgi:hypothetical protein